MAYQIHVLTVDQMDAVLSPKQKTQLRKMILKLRTDMKKKVPVLKYIDPNTEEYTQAKNKLSAVQCDPGYTYILAGTASGEIIGYLAYALSSVSGIVQLTEMYIKEEYRGQHIFTALEKTLVEKTVESGCRVIEVNTYPDDESIKYGTPSLCLQKAGYVNTSDIYTYLPHSKRTTTTPGKQWIINDEGGILVDSYRKEYLYQCIKTTNTAISSYGATLRQALQKSTPTLPTLSSVYYSASRLKKGKYVPEFYFDLIDASPTVKFVNAILPTPDYGYYTGADIVTDIRREFSRWFHNKGYEAILHTHYLNNAYNTEIIKRQHCLEMLGLKRSLMTMYKEV